SENIGGSGVAQVNYFYCPGTGCAPATLIGSSSSASGNYAVNWNQQPADGTYTVLAQTQDNAGNTANSATQTTMIDNTKPSQPALSTVPGSIKTGQSQARWTMPVG